LLPKGNLSDTLDGPAGGILERKVTRTMTETTTATTTEKIHDPIHSVSYSFSREGEKLWVHSWLEAGGHLPEHFHPTLEERWEVLEGTARVKLDGAWRDLVPEDGPLLVAPEVRHELRNESDRQAHLRTEVTPAGRLQEFLTETARAAREGLYNSRNMPTSWRGAVWAADLAQRFRDETVMCSPPQAVQRVLTPVVARFAHR
jgi:quercetin dioxygenase-like cupin family protein